MDLETESVEDNEVIQESLPSNHNNNINDGHMDGNSIKDNGSCVDETENLVAAPIVDANASSVANTTKSVVDQEPIVSSPLATKSPDGPSHPSTKGYGLKKWRRIKRDFVKDGIANADGGKILKRGLSGSANPVIPLHSSSTEIRRSSDGSGGPADAVYNVGVPEGFSICGSGLDSRSAVGPALAAGTALDSRFSVGGAFSAGTESENSEDRGSRSSTAASVPKVKHGLPSILGHVRDKNQMKSSNAKIASNSTQRVQQGKSQVKSSKKPRGERVKIEKENSHSSIESDSRSCNFVFMQGMSSATSNGKISSKSMHYDEENSDEAHASGQQFSGGGQNVGEAEPSQYDLAADLSSEAKDVKSSNHRPSLVQDPLAKSILALQSVQDALEEEVQKLGNIGKESVISSGNAVDSSGSPLDSSIGDLEYNEPSSSDQLAWEKTNKAAAGAPESEIFILTQKVKYLESKLEEARSVLEVKECRISELEAAANREKSAKEESGSTAGLQEKYRDMESVLEGAILQKMEAEIECVALKTTIKKLIVSAGDEMRMLEEQMALAGEQADALSKLGEAETKAANIKKQAEELEKYCEEMVGVEEVVKMQKRVSKLSTCFITQLMLLVIVIWLFVIQLSPHSGIVVPT